VNLYITRFPKRVGHICAGANATITNADNKIVGYVTPEVADWLIRSGAAMDVTER
jgi:hypothetical protein